MSKSKIKELFKKVDEEGEIYLGALTSQELRETGFAPVGGANSEEEEDEFFNSFDYVYIYLFKQQEGYTIKYDFDHQDQYYESQRDLREFFECVLEGILEAIESAK